MSISSSTDYKLNVYAPSREVKARVTVTMSAFSQASAQVINCITNFYGKVSASNVESTHIAKYGIGQTSLQSPSGTWTSEFTQFFYDNIKTLNGQYASTTTTTNLVIPQHLIGFDVIYALEKKFGKNIWQNRNATLAQKITKAKTLITKLTFNCNGYGTSPTGNRLSNSIWNGSAWTGVVFNTSDSVTQNKLINTTLSDKIDANGFMWFNAYANASNGTATSSNVFVDYVELILEVTNTTTRTFEDDRIISAKVVEETSILNVTSPANSLELQLDNTDDLFNFINLSNMQQIVASRPKFDLEFGVVLSDLVSVEWIPIGSFYMANWKNNVGNISVNFTCYDLLWILSNTSFPIQAIGNVGTAVQSLMSGAGITDYYYDPLLDSLSGSSRPTRITNCRELLQNLCISTGLTLYQDRNGQVRLEKMKGLAQSTTYTTFTTTQNSLFGGYTSNTTVGGQPKAVSKQDTDGGMRAITLEQMYEIPSITLDSTIYQINVNVYKNNPTDDSYDVYTYTNPNITGNAGESFTIDIPLIQSTTVAQQVAQRFFDETAFNAVYVSRWRQNPVLVATDVIVINDSITSAKQTRVTKQEYLYQGFLTGTTESRGGI